MFSKQNNDCSHENFPLGRERKKKKHFEREKFLVGFVVCLLDFLFFVLFCAGGFGSLLSARAYRY
jgi:hypothetical protein